MLSIFVRSAHFAATTHDMGAYYRVKFKVCSHVAHLPLQANGTWRSEHKWKSLRALIHQVVIFSAISLATASSKFVNGAELALPISGQTTHKLESPSNVQLSRPY